MTSTNAADRPVNPRETIRSSPLALRMTQKVRVEHEIDVVAFFTDLPVGQQIEYHSSSYADVGCYAEWEKPLGFLISRADVDGETMLGASAAVVETVEDGGDIDQRVDYRHSVLSRGRDEGAWSEHDFQTLITAVPWMAPDAEPSAEDVARIPGPRDVAFDGLLG